MPTIKSSFFQRPAGEVKQFISGPNPERPVYICDDQEIDFQDRATVRQHRSQMSAVVECVNRYDV
jgi:hypothetical protein